MSQAKEDTQRRWGDDEPTLAKKSSWADRDSDEEWGDDDRENGDHSDQEKEKAPSTSSDHAKTSDYREPRSSDRPRDDYYDSSRDRERSSNDSYRSERRGYGDDRYGRDRNDRGDRNDRRRDTRETREPREPREALPIPTEPPFTAHLGNLAWEVRDDDVRDFFRDCKIVSVRIVIDKRTNRSKGYGYVEFDDVESLKTALSLSGQDLLGRELKVDVAAAKKDDDRREWSTAGRDRRDRRDDRRTDRRDDRRDDRRRDEGERRRLEIKPRSERSDEVESTSDSSPPQKRSSNPFGDAKPRDETAAQRSAEDRRKERETQDQDAKTTATTAPRDVRPRDDKPRQDRPRDDKRDDRRDDRRRDDRRDDRKGAGAPAKKPFGNNAPRDNREPRKEGGKPAPFTRDAPRRDGPRPGAPAVAPQPDKKKENKKPVNPFEALQNEEVPDE